MKFLLLLFLVGIASAASIYDVSHDVDDELIVASHFTDVLHGLEFADEDEDDKLYEIQKKLKEHFKNLLERIKEALEKGNFKGDLLEKLKELKEKIKGRLSDETKELLQKIKDKIRDYVKKLLDKFGEKDEQKRSISEFKETIRDLFRRLKKALLEKIDGEKLKEKIEELFGHGTRIAEQILEKLKEKGEKGKKKLLDFIDRILGVDETAEKRSIVELWEKVRDYFKKIHLDIKEKFMKFGEWAREKLAHIGEKVKDKKEALRELAKELKDHIHEVGKDVAAQGLEFLRPYKEDLGALWDQLKESVKEIMGKQD